MTPQDCVEYAEKMAQKLGVSCDLNYVRSQSQHIIDCGRGKNLEMWCSGYLLELLVCYTEAYKQYVSMCQEKYSNDLNKLINNGYKGAVFSFENQYGKAIKTKLYQIKMSVI